MAEVIIMPKLGFNMDEGQLVKWHKQAGDGVKKGEVLFEINTDKTTMPVEATEDGVMLKILLNEGEFAEVFTPIAVVGGAGENPDAALAAFDGGAASPDTAAKAVEASRDAPVSAPLKVDAGELKLTPKAKKLIRDEGIDAVSLAGLQGTGYQGGITARDIKASPLARKLAEQKEIDLGAVQGSGADGKVMKADVEAAAAPAPEAAAPGETRILSTAPYKGVRKVIGERLAHSKFTAPHIYFTDSIDTTAFSAFRRQLNEAGTQKIGVSDLLTMAAGKALAAFPGINASLVDERIIQYKSINIGIAVAGENGLIVPVVKNVQEKTLTMVAEESRELVECAKAGRLAPGEFSGGTFTISNLGMFGIENFTAIINPPESAILAVSAVRKKAVVVTNDNGGDEIVIRPMMNVQLTVDHRLIDGLLAARFVAYFKELLENPLRILM